METKSEEREDCLRRHRERDGARWASPTVDQTQARLEHNASYRHTHLQQLATNRQRRLESEMAEESYTRFFFSAISIFPIHDSFFLLFQYFSRIYVRAMFVSHAPWICQPLFRPP